MGWGQKIVIFALNNIYRLFIYIFRQSCVEESIVNASAV
jgi:hypothetical protein